MIRENGIDRQPNLPFLLLLVITLLPAGIAYLLSMTFADRPIIVLLAVNLFLVLVVGIVLGAAWRGSHVGVYAVVAAVAGVLHFLVLRAAFGSAYEFSFFNVLLPDALTIFGGALFGDLLERAIAPGRLQPDYAESLAQRIAGAADPLALRRLTFVIAVLSPVLVLFIALALAVLSYSGGAAPAS